MVAESVATIPVAGARIAYRRIGSGRPLVMLNGLAATSVDWDPSFVDGLASANELVLLDNRGIGASTDNGEPFDIARLADDTSRVIEARSCVVVTTLSLFAANKLPLNRMDATVSHAIRFMRFP